MHSCALARIRASVHPGRGLGASVRPCVRPWAFEHQRVHACMRGHPCIPECGLKGVRASLRESVRA
eukprot:6173645-Alexandrium_andersonii.AAC.1